MGLRGLWACTYCGARKRGEQPDNDGCPRALDNKHLWNLIEREPPTGYNELVNGYIRLCFVEALTRRD